ncbi:shwachman-Bodian-diamond syndrome protein-like protein [Ampelomyces quisqualis]|uniref:Shwachman-Bodian-diamond syndrome protein-like protein n=1 Tax=Ampelomyces quisqualis TaxID=50730 RepID=A0A6A5QGC3_AMPQU|nr:shwachman-Bodian-diamond syndrome protein-like protein [Ampelomyces quisqualis]
MPVGINQPSNQIKLTNVSLVRMKKGKKRFEIACYKNKVLEYRNRIETDLSNVLQIENVFLNVSKGQVAPKADLEKAFPKKPLEAIITDILENGELQVGEKERNAELERTKNEVIDIVAGKLVDPKTKRVYTSGMIEKALDGLSSQAASAHQHGQGEKKEKEAEGKQDGEDKGKAKELPKWTGIVTTKSAKSQALFAMKALIAHQPIPVARMQMKLRITCPTSVLKQAAKVAPKTQSSAEEKSSGTVKDAILGLMENMESQDTVGAEWEAVGLVEPGAFKALNELIEGQTKGRGNVEVLEMAVGADD